MKQQQNRTVAAWKGVDLLSYDLEVQPACLASTTPWLHCGDHEPPLLSFIGRLCPSKMVQLYMRKSISFAERFRGRVYTLQVLSPRNNYSHFTLEFLPHLESYIFNLIAFFINRIGLEWNGGRMQWWNAMVELNGGMATFDG